MLLESFDGTNKMNRQSHDEEQVYNTRRAINDDKIETYSKEDKKDDDTSKEIRRCL